VLVLVGSTAAVAALSASALTGWMRRLAARDSRWLRSGLHVALAAAAAAGGALLAADWAELVAFTQLAVGCALLIVIDLATLRLPDRLVGPLYLGVLLALTVSAAAGGHWLSLGRAGVAGGILLVVFFALAWLRPDGLGLGDVKLAGLLGAFLGWLGWSSLVIGSAAAFLLAGLVAVALLITGRGTRRTTFPFGPWMVLGAAIGALSTAASSGGLLG
jgi:leader peptidase (prepilin peptidase) / N-methyltransferase